jgi:hypothetical protein
MIDAGKLPKFDQESFVLVLRLKDFDGHVRVAPTAV